MKEKDEDNPYARYSRNTAVPTFRVYKIKETKDYLKSKYIILQT